MNKHELYLSIRDELSEKCDSIRHFNRRFLDDYINCLNQRRENLKNGIDDSYRDEKAPHVVLYHCWDDVYDSRFYQKNSCAYCEFLSIISGKV